MTDEEFLINPKADIQAFQSTMNVMKKYNYSGTFEIRGVEMTDEKIKEMLKDIIDNDAEYEFTYKDYNGDYVPWIPFKLGYEIRNGWEYRKIEKWYVYESYESYENRTYKTEPLPKSYEKYSHLFVGTKEECEKWIEEHTKKTWLKELNSKISPNAKGLDFKVKETATEVCKKILEETKKLWQEDSDYFSDLEGIIKDLGVEV